MSEDNGKPPRIGRYRLYDREGKGHLRCRICGEKIRFENQWKHMTREVGPPASPAEIALLRLELVLARERAAHWRKRSQYYHEKALKESGVELK